MPSPSFEVPVVTASLSRRELRQRLEVSSVEPVIETRRERRERELAAAAAASSVESEASASVAAAVTAPAAAPVATATAATPAATTPATTPAAGAVAGSAAASPLAAAMSAAGVRAAESRRARRAVTGLDHLLPASVPAEATSSPAAAAAPAATAEAVGAASVTVPAATSTPATSTPAAATPAASPAAPSVRATTASTPAAPAPAAAATTVHTMTFSRDDEAQARGPVAAPRGARASVSTGDPQRRVLPRMRRASAPRPDSRKRTIVNSAVMVATASLVATIALPAYAYSTPDSLENPKVTASSELGIQQLTVSGANAQSSSRDDFTTTGNLAAMDSTTGTTVSATVQALASELMADVASGKLVGSVPDHIVEIRNLANGVAVPGCGVDYRVLQTIKVAVDNFDKVGVSDINRHCTGQIEGAGTASSHYKDGGGHAVDFYILNGHGLTGADSDSIKLINLLDPLVPKGSGLGQAECRSTSLPLSNFAAFDDTCTHMHVDFGNAQGVALKG
ncbi:hypothetical protein [Subtercola sp. Z020]|uniref:hypothetical protein n=1 Tax=Subtercola sp. Z020 TaxID=2080582 RepID=UPI0011B05114|nr:hypothetical protein [Subtercola sp. Z020]